MDLEQGILNPIFFYEEPQNSQLCSKRYLKRVVNDVNQTRSRWTQDPQDILSVQLQNNSNYFFVFCTFSYTKSHGVPNLQSEIMKSCLILSRSFYKAIIFSLQSNLSCLDRCPDPKKEQQIVNILELHKNMSIHGSSQIFCLAEDRFFVSLRLVLNKIKNLQKVCNLGCGRLRWPITSVSKVMLLYIFLDDWKVTHCHF